MFFEIQSANPNVQQPTTTPISVRCPACKQRGTLDGMTNAQDMHIQIPGFPGVVVFGQRRCPNPTCHKHIFVVINAEKLLVSYPPERLDFDSTDIPASVKTAFEEAISCHSQQCFIASAIMVRKTLEELCRDRGATGDSLKARLKSLATKIVLPTELLDGLDDLRLLGNDAAHIESREYDRVGKDEVEVGIEFAKEVLKAVYQYSSLLNKLRALKKNATLPAANTP
jgi:hypothetical protein